MMQKRFATLAIAISIMSLLGCAATQTAIEKRDLAVTSHTDRPLFVTPGLGNKVFVRVRNVCSLKVSSEELQRMVEQKFLSRGYQIVQTPQEADYVVQAQLISAKANIVPARMRGDSAGGSAGAVAGALLGAAAGTWQAVGIGAGAGTVAGSLVEGITGSMVKDVTYTLEFAVKVSDRTGNSGETTLSVSAGKVNLDPKVGTQVLLDHASDAIANII